MVAYHDLYDCRVDQWQKASDDWVDLARRSASAAEDIRAQGKKPLDDHWAHATGKTAGRRLEDLADRLESCGDIMKGVAMVLDALAHSMGYAQRTLFHAVELAGEHGLSIQDGRAVGTGDIIFYEQVAPDPDEPQGEIYHAAVVTSVTPDGDIKLTQHTSSFQNVSLDSRVHVATRNHGEQRVHIVRPHPDWY